MSEVSVAVTLPVLRNGDGPGGTIGVHVQVLQALLNIKGHNPVSGDGRFTSVVEAAVRAFQIDRALVVDGIVGRQTWTALLDRPQTA